MNLIILAERNLIQKNTYGTVLHFYEVLVQATFMREKNGVVCLGNRQELTGKDYEGTFFEVMVMVWVTRCMNL